MVKNYKFLIIIRLFLKILSHFLISI